MENHEYNYIGSESYYYPGTSVLKNKLGIKDDNSLTIAEREITSLKLLIFYNLSNEKFLCSLDKHFFVERIAYYIGEVNALHPFREGNGRTSREFFRQLSLSANYILDFSKTDKDELLRADIEAFNGKYNDLIKILNKAINVK